MQMLADKCGVGLGFHSHQPPKLKIEHSFKIILALHVPVNFILSRIATVGPVKVLIKELQRKHNPNVH